MTEPSIHGTPPHLLGVESLRDVTELEFLDKAMDDLGPFGFKHFRYVYESETSDEMVQFVASKEPLES